MDVLITKKVFTVHLFIYFYRIYIQFTPDELRRLLANRGTTPFRFGAIQKVQEYGWPSTTKPTHLIASGMHSAQNMELSGLGADISCPENWTSSNLSQKFGSEYNTLVKTITGEINYNREKSGQGGNCSVDPVYCAKEYLVSCVLNTYWQWAASKQYAPYIADSSTNTVYIISKITKSTAIFDWRVKEILDRLYYITNAKNTYHLDRRYLDPVGSGYATTSGGSAGTTPEWIGYDDGTSTPVVKKTTTKTTSSNTSKPPVNPQPSYTQPPQEASVSGSSNTGLYIGGAIVLGVLFFMLK